MNPSEALDTPPVPGSEPAVEGLRIRNVPLSELELQHDRDWEWAFHNPAIRRQYSEQVIAVFQEKVLGSGEDHAAALASALQHPDCPERRWLTFFPVPMWIDLATASARKSVEVKPE